MNNHPSIRRFLGPIVLSLIAVCAFAAFLAYAQDGPAQSAPDQAKKQKKAGTPVVNARELPLELTTETMEVLRTSLGVECNYCHVSGEFQERGHAGDRQSDANPRKLIARDMIKMTKDINRNLTGVGVFPDLSNVVTCWTCHRGNRRPPIAPSAAVSASGSVVMP